MQTVLVSKTGMSWCSREEARLNSSTGEQGETEGIMRHLVARGDVRVVYFGAYRGELPPGVEGIRPAHGHLREDSTGDAQRSGWLCDEVALEDLKGDVLCVLNVAGPPATFSHVDNPKGSIIQLQGIKYTGPVLNALRYLDVPRVVINNDPRTYPRDQEMSYGWKRVRPAALLDQCDASVDMVVGGCDYRRVSRYAGCESWAWLPPEAGKPHSERIPVGVVAHAHIRDGCRQRKRKDSWFNVLGESYMWPNDLNIWGQGWEYYGRQSAIRGPCKPSEALEIFGALRCTPCVAAAPGFYTGKPYVAMSRGCVPILYGDGTDPYTWDPKGELVSLDSLDRCVRPGDLWKITEQMSDWKNWFVAQTMWRGLLQPRWQVLDELVDFLLEGGDLLETDKFGGYFRA